MSYWSVLCFLLFAYSVILFYFFLAFLVSQKKKHIKTNEQFSNIWNSTPVGEFVLVPLLFLLRVKTFTQIYILILILMVENCESTSLPFLKVVIL